MHKLWRQKCWHCGLEFVLYMESEEKPPQAATLKCTEFHQVIQIDVADLQSCHRFVWAFVRPKSQHQLGNAGWKTRNINFTSGENQLFYRQKLYCIAW